jgi:hypothetical protein
VQTICIGRLKAKFPALKDGLRFKSMQKNAQMVQVSLVVLGVAILVVVVKRRKSRQPFFNLPDHKLADSRP